jgi:uncharacterized DUF497 family protein
MIEFRFNVDRETGQPHIYDHGVSEEEVEEVFRNRPETRPGMERYTRVAMGKTHGGRYLKVIYVPDDDGIGIYVITAYDLRGKALHAHRRRMRRRFR